MFSLINTPTFVKLGTHMPTQIIQSRDQENGC